MRERVVLPRCFDLRQTLDCGQAFRWRELSHEEDACMWEGAAFGRALKLRQTKDSILLFCSEEEFEAVWRGYFDLDADYEEKRRRLSAIRPILAEASSYAPGIRILRQDSWEALCSFLISQNNNIPRIKGIIERFCQAFGSPIPGSSFFSFPTPEALASRCLEDLAPLRAGFRAKYLLDAAKKVAGGEISLEEISRESAGFGRIELQKILGVGPKVAECTLLYGYHKTDCFPMDVWMKRAMAILLPDYSAEDFGEDAGLAQQYLFHYSRMHPELFQACSEAG